MKWNEKTAWLMKKILLILLPILLLLQVAFPACFVVAMWMDLYFQACHPEAFALVTVALMLIGAVLAWCCRSIKSKCYNVLCSFLLPLSIVSGVVFIARWSLFMTIMTVLNIFCAVVLFYYSTGKWKWLCAILSGWLSYLFVPMCLVVFGLKAVMPGVTVIEKYPSPDGTYTAQVVVLDGGGRGASTKVYLYDHSRDVELLIVRLGLEEEQIYSGEWHDYETLTVRWLDEDTLLIDGERYDVQ